MLLCCSREGGCGGDGWPDVRYARGASQQHCQRRECIGTDSRPCAAAGGDGGPHAEAGIRRRRVTSQGPRTEAESSKAQREHRSEPARCSLLASDMQVIGKHEMAPHCIHAVLQLGRASYTTTFPTTNEGTALRCSGQAPVTLPGGTDDWLPSSHFASST